jgi:hypothetical protein
VVQAMAMKKSSCSKKFQSVHLLRSQKVPVPLPTVSKQKGSRGAVQFWQLQKAVKAFP